MDMIERVIFRNFKALKNTTLPLSPFTLLVGPNGSGKSSAIKALQFLTRPGSFQYQKIVSVDSASKPEDVTVTVAWTNAKGFQTTSKLGPGGADPLRITQAGVEAAVAGHVRQSLNAALQGLRVFSLEANAIASDVGLQPHMELNSNGQGLAGVLDQLRDQNPERFEILNEELGRWLPEFERILFTTPGTGQRRFQLRTRIGHHPIEAGELSQGTLLALAMLTLVHLPTPPTIVCLEEPDRGIHPRLLRDVRDSLYRLSYPQDYGEKREPVQVLATTHSPYMLDLFKDHPEEVVLAHKSENQARFERLTDRPDIDEILKSAHLGDVWYSGILGGVPSGPGTTAG